MPEVKSLGLLVLGMGRSGTSALTAALGHLGFELGPPEDLIAPDDQNVHGYFEVGRLTLLNDRIRMALGMLHNSCIALPDQWREFDHIPQLVTELSREIGTFAKGKRLWAIKDPRMSLLLPIYHSVAPNAGIVICLRHPEASSESFAKKFQVPRVYCLGLWMQHNLTALRDSRLFESRTVCSYDDLIRSTEIELEKVVGSEVWASLPEASRSRAIESLDPALSHGAASEITNSFARRVWQLCERCLSDRDAFRRGDRDREIDELCTEFFEIWGTVPSPMILTTSFQLGWMDHGTQRTVSQRYVPSGLAQTLSIPISVPEGTEVLGMLTHLPGVIRIHEMFVVIDGEECDLDFLWAQDLPCHKAKQYDEWTVPYPGYHFSFRAPAGLSHFCVRVSGSVTPDEITRLAAMASQTIRELSQGR